MIITILVMVIIVILVVIVIIVIVIVIANSTNIWSTSPRPCARDCCSSSGTVGFHNSNLRIFNLRVSNPNELIVDAFLTRCRISMCQGLGPTKTR